MKYLKSIILMLTIFLISNIFITLLSYFDIFNEKGINIIKIITVLIILIITGINIGINSKKKAYLEGLKTSLLIIILFTIINLVIPGLDMNIKTIIYYFIIIIINILFSSIGINFKRKE